MGEVKPLVRALTPPAHLTTDHDLTKFACGKEPLDDWLRNLAIKSEGRTARTYVVCEDGNVVVGYYCILAGNVQRGELPPKLKREQGLPHQVSVAIIGRLARDVRYRGVGLGPDLLRDALIRIVSASTTIGIRCVLVHALDDEAADFYRAREFIEWPVGEKTFYLPIETIKAAASS